MTDSCIGRKCESGTFCRLVTERIAKWRPQRQDGGQRSTWATLLVNGSLIVGSRDNQQWPVKYVQCHVIYGFAKALGKRARDVVLVG